MLQERRLKTYIICKMIRPSIPYSRLKFLTPWFYPGFNFSPLYRSAIMRVQRCGTYTFKLQTRRSDNITGD